MSQLMIINITGIIGTLISTISFIPQVYKTYKTQNTDGLSFWFIILTIIASLAWIIYAYCMKSWHQFTANFIILVLSIILLQLFISYENKNK